MEVREAMTTWRRRGTRKRCSASGKGVSVPRVRKREISRESQKDKVRKLEGFQCKKIIIKDPITSTFK